jgi:hypothetical protein
MASMSRKKGRKLDESFYEDEDMEKDVICPPQQVPSSNLNEECDTSHASNESYA